MKQYFFVPLLMILTCCNAPTVTASPLETFDQDRLWILLRAVGEAEDSPCSYYYRDKPRLGGGYFVRDPTESCTSFTDELATYLAHNGVSGVKSVHLRTPAFWNSLMAMFVAIDTCQEQLGGWALSPPNHKIPRGPMPGDYGYYEREEFNAAYRKHLKQKSNIIKKHQRAWRACDPYLRALQPRVDAIVNAIETCRERLGGTKSTPPNHKIPRKPGRRDYETTNEWVIAEGEYKKQMHELVRKHRRDWKACDPDQLFDDRNVFRYFRPRPTLQDDRKWLGIRLPPGLSLLD